MRRKVFDHGNKKRLLGTVEVKIPMVGKTLEMVVGAPPRLRSYYEAAQQWPQPLPYERLLFYYDVIEGRFENNGWTRVEDIHLSTDAKLEDLMKIESFRLPGETESAAEYRRRAALNA
jgi:hypothetical protein